MQAFETGLNYKIYVHLIFIFYLKFLTFKDCFNFFRKIISYVRVDSVKNFGDENNDESTKK